MFCIFPYVLCYMMSEERGEYGENNEMKIVFFYRAKEVIRSIIVKVEGENIIVFV